MDMNDVWAFEIDVEYSGGLLLEIETRIEVMDSEIQRDVPELNQESNLVKDINSDLAEGSEHHGGKCDFPGRRVDGSVSKSEWKDGSCFFGFLTHQDESLKTRG